MENNDIGSVIGKLLENPETLSRLMSVAGGIMEGMKQETEPTVSQNAVENGRSAEDTLEQTEHEKAVSAANDGRAFEGAGDTAKLLASLMGGIKPKANDPRCALLYALKPYMSSQRAERIDTLVKALGVSELANGFLRQSGLFM